MISSPVSSDGDHNKSMGIENKKKQMSAIKSVHTDIHMAEEFFFQSHPFSDLILLVQDRELHVDKSILAVGSKVFQTYFQDDSIDSIEILDVSPNEMIELLRFLYPQFRCTINNQNVTILLILAYRFEIDFLSSACRTFILFYLSKLAFIHMPSSRASTLLKQEDGTCLSIASILEILCVWFREFSYINDVQACDAVLDKLARCHVSSVVASDGFKDLEENMKWKIVQARVKYLENK